jgi:CrcB-like protein
MWQAILCVSAGAVLGAFTTFSSFSSETIELFMSEKWLNGLVVILLHVTGGLFSTALGLVLYGLLVKS